MSAPERQSEEQAVSASTLPDFEKKEKVRRALQEKKGRATLGDIIVATGLPKGESEGALRGLLSEYESHLAVDDKGEILYLFEPSFLKRGERDLWARRWRALARWLWKAFVLAFKVAIMLTLVVYFVLFVVLIIAAIIAMNSNSNDNNSSSSSRSNSGGGLGWVFWFWGGNSSSYDDDYRSYRGASKPKPKELPFYQKVFNFVFGPEDPKTDALAEERALLSWIRSQKGRITAADLATRTGEDLHAAEERATKLIVDYGGDVEVSDNGTLLYTFKDLLVRGGQGGDVPAAQPAWRKFLPPQTITGNTGGTNALIIFFNGFITFGALLAPGFIFPALGFESTAAWIGLYYFPLGFAALFFGVPLLRIPGVMAENKRRLTRNLRLASMETLYEHAQKQPLVIEPKQAQGQIERNYLNGLKSLGLDPQGDDRRAYSGVSPEAAIQQGEAGAEWLLKNFEGQPNNLASGAIVYQFDRVSRELVDAQLARKEARADEEALGGIVYRSDN